MFNCVVLLLQNWLWFIGHIYNASFPFKFHNFWFFCINPKIFENLDFSKPCNVDIHWIALAEYSQMSTHMPGVLSFLSFFALFCIGKIIHQQHMG